MAPTCTIDFSPGIPLTRWRTDVRDFEGGWYNLSDLATLLKPKPAVSLKVELVADYDAGKPHSVKVTAMDRNGHVATGYRGTVRFSSSDPRAALPADYTFSLADAGVHYFMFEVTLWTPGSQWVEVTDALAPLISGRQGTLVG